MYGGGPITPNWDIFSRSVNYSFMCLLKVDNYKNDLNLSQS